MFLLSIYHAISLSLHKAMELFLDLVLEIAFSVVLCFFLAKFLSPSVPNDEGANFKPTHHPKSNDFDCSTKRKIGFASEIVLVDEEEPSKDVKTVSLTKKVGEERSKEVKTVSLTKNVGDQSCKVDCSVFECQQSSLDEGYRTGNEGEIEVDLVKEDAGIDENEEVEVLKCEVDNEISGLKDDGLVDKEDDWEGIERTELERMFGAAVAFVGSKGNAGKVSTLGSDLKLQLYGLHKLAIEGPCLAPQPMALKISARAKWNAWQQLGNMSPEVAMEQYIYLLSRNIPSWIDVFKKDGKQDFADAEASRKLSSQRNIDEPMASIEVIDVDPNSYEKEK